MYKKHDVWGTRDQELATRQATIMRAARRPTIIKEIPLNPTMRVRYIRLRVTPPPHTIQALPIRMKKRKKTINGANWMRR